MVEKELIFKRQSFTLYLLPDHHLEAPISLDLSDTLLCTGVGLFGANVIFVIRDHGKELPKLPPLAWLCEMF